MPTMSKARGQSSSRKPASPGSKASCRSAPTRRTARGAARSWLKIKCLKGEEFVIGGYSRSERPKGKPFSSLLLGSFEDGKLVYAGKVGTGFDSADFDRLCAKTFDRSSARVRRSRRCRATSARTRCGSNPSSSPRSTLPNGRATGGSVIRAFRACVRTRTAREVHREQSNDEDAGMATTKSAPAKKARNPVFAGITLTNPDKVYYPDSRPHEARRRPLLRDGRHPSCFLTW